MPMSPFSIRSRRPRRRPGRSPVARAALVLLLGLVVTSALARGVAAQDADAAAQDADTAAAPSSDVWMFRGNSMRTGAQPGPAPQGNPVLKWAFQTDGAVRSSPAIADGAAFVGSKDGNLYAIDLATGQERWRFATGGPVVSSPAVKDGVVYVGSQDGYFYAIDAVNGERRWSYRLWAAGSPTISEDLLFVSTTGKTLHAIDTVTGLERWHAAFSFSLTEPAVAGQSVYVGADGLIQAFDKNTGLLRWIFDEAGTSTASVVVSLGRVYALSTDSGEQEVQVDEEASSNNERNASPTGDENNDAGGGGVAAQGSKVYSLDAETGTLRWTYVMPTGTPPLSSFALVDGTLFVGSDRGWLYALDPNTGRQFWGYQTDGAVVASPVVADGQVFIGSFGGGFHVLDAKTGAVKWIHDVGAPVGSSAAVVDGMVYFGTDGGALVAVAGSGPPAAPAEESSEAPADETADSD
jgi:eukaryotic-like serine/threonine-protein kinase